MLDFGTAKNELSHVIAGGSCNATIMTREINMAQAWFANKNDWHTTLQRYSFCTANGCLVLPREIASIRRVRVDGVLVDVHSLWFEYQANGPGNLDNKWFDCYNLLTLENPGPVINQPCGCNHILALSDREEDKEAEVIIRGTDCAGLEVRNTTCTEFEWGESLPLRNIEIMRGGLEKAFVGDDRCPNVTKIIPKYTCEKFKKISHISKPITKGYVWIFEYCPETKNFRTLARLHPTDTASEYQIFRLRPDYDGDRQLSILAKRRFIPAVNDTDVLYIQSLPALYEAVQMLYRRRNNDIKNAVQHEGAAMQHLSDQLSSHNKGVINEVDVDAQTWGGGRIYNMS